MLTDPSLQLKPLTSIESEVLRRSKEWFDRRKAIDPSIFKPKYYNVDITVENAADAFGFGTRELDSIRPFILDSVTYSMIGEIPDNQGRNLLINWRDSIQTFADELTLAPNLWGNVYKGDLIPLPTRLFLRASQLLRVDLLNPNFRSERPSFIDVQVTFIGFEPWEWSF